MPIFTMTPQSRPPSPKHPLFTTKFFSTKSFGPGHIVGAGILVFGTLAIAKAFRTAAQKESRGTAEAAQAAARATRDQVAVRGWGRENTRGPVREEVVTMRAHERGQYGAAADKRIERAGARMMRHP